MQTIAEMNQNVGAFVLEHAGTSTPADRGIESLCRVLDSIDAVPVHLIKRAREKCDACYEAVNHYVSQRLAETYPLVSPELLERQRWIGVELRRGAGWNIKWESLSEPENLISRHKDASGTWTKHWFEIPLLLRSGYSETRLHARLSGFGDYHIAAKTPEIPFKAEQCRREATAIVMDVVAELLRVERTSHIAEQMLLEKGYRDNSINSPEYRIAWVPLLDELRIEAVPPDPALLLEIGDYTHLVTHWDAPGERPIESILREYTTGSFPASLDND